MGVGQRIEIGGVKGEVAKLGLVEFALNETNAAGQRTGRQVLFSNSCVFLSPATPLFREVSPCPADSRATGLGPDQVARKSPERRSP